MQQNENRRSFLQKTLFASVASLGIPSFLEATSSTSSFQSKERLTILFQGDSITDAWRRKEFYYPNDAPGMGLGYVHQIVSHLLGKNPQQQINCYNRGISGNKVFQLAKRWDDDCLQLQPDILSLLIGVNDFWHTLSHGYGGTAKTYETDLRELLDRTKQQLPEVKLIIAEPFAVKGGSAITDEWFPAFNAYQASTKAIAKDYDAHFIPLQQLFDNALKLAPVDYWCPDGVHPSLAGNYLMAEAWLSILNSYLK